MRGSVAGDGAREAGGPRAWSALEMPARWRACGLVETEGFKQSSLLVQHALTSVSHRS